MIWKGLNPVSFTKTEVLETVEEEPEDAVEEAPSSMIQLVLSELVMYPVLQV